MLCAIAGCGGGGGSAVVDAGIERSMTGMCGADVPSDQRCSTLVDIGEAVVPTCATATMPTGTGGTIVDGTYVLTAQTYYNVPACPKFGLSQTIQIAGDCMQIASGTLTPATASAKLTIAGNSLTTVRTCLRLDSDAGVSMAGPSSQTFTATPTTFTLFTDYTVAGEPGSDNVAVYTKL